MHVGSNMEEVPWPPLSPSSSLRFSICEMLQAGEMSWGVGTSCYLHASSGKSPPAPITEALLSSSLHDVLSLLLSIHCGSQIDQNNSLKLNVAKCKYVHLKIYGRNLDWQQIV